MAISLQTRKMLWGRSAHRCAICKMELVVDSTQTDDEAIIGDECHIVGKKIDGPRGDYPLDLGKRDNYDNLIILCKIHHKVIDEQPQTYTIDKIKEIKRDHEQWVRSSLSEYDDSKQKDDEIYTRYIEVWEKKADIQNWLGWSSNVMSPEHYMDINLYRNLEDLRLWILSRVWPKRYESLEASFENFRRVLEDFQKVFRMHSVKWGDDSIKVNKFYQIEDWNPEKYNRLLNEYEFHVALIQDLMLELTRAANYTCDQVRKFIFSSYRLEEGAILVEIGPYKFLEFEILRVKYKSDEMEHIPYPGLQNFLVVRRRRDIHFGEGTSPNDVDFTLGDAKEIND